jgi:hypothetical protein
MSEPMWLDGDDVALGINQACDVCEAKDNESHCDCGHCDCGEPDPDRLHDEMGEQ